MAAEIEAHLDAMVTALNVAHTHYDLSASDAVKLGIWLQPPTDGAFACIGNVDTTSDQGPPMRQWQTDASATIMGWAPVPGQDPDAGQRAALQLANDIRQALYDAFRADGNILKRLRTFKVDLSAANGDLAAMAPGYGFVLGTVEWSYKTTDTARGI